MPRQLLVLQLHHRQRGQALQQIRKALQRQLAVQCLPRAVLALRRRRPLCRAHRAGGLLGPALLREQQRCRPPPQHVPLYVIGATSDHGGRGPGSFRPDDGRSRDRDICPEGIEATIYSALGIEWTKVRYDDALGRCVYCVPVADDDVHAPVNELFDTPEPEAAIAYAPLLRARLCENSDLRDSSRWSNRRPALADVSQRHLSTRSDPRSTHSSWSVLLVHGKSIHPTLRCRRRRSLPAMTGLQRRN